MSERCPCCGQAIVSPYGQTFVTGPFAGLPSRIAQILFRESLRSRDEVRALVSQDVIDFWGHPRPWWTFVRGFGPKSAAIVEQWVAE
jgi:hypothetical protein